MAQRYRGDVVITVEWKDKLDRYYCVLKCPDATFAHWINRPAVSPLAVDSSKAYDAVAQAALAFTMDRSNDSLPAVREAAIAISDAAASGIGDGFYIIERKQR